MKAIIIGAGRGRRMMPETRDLPKCMLAGFDGRRVLDWILDALRAAGIDEIVFVGGFRMNAIRKAYPDLRFIRNSLWRHNNILESLMCASEDLDRPIVVSYSDILYEADVVKRLVATDADVALATDPDWRRRYTGRSLHPEGEAEKTAVSGGYVCDIGKHLDAHAVQGEFIGLSYFSARAAVEMRLRYVALKNSARNSPFHSSRSLRQAYLTDMIKELIESGLKVKPVPVLGMWDELDTPEDVKRVRDRLHASAKVR